LKILIIHNYYQLRGGEDAVFEQEFELLKQNNEVEALIFYNKGGLQGAFQFLLSCWNIFASIRLKKCIDNFQPDIIHLHNWHFASGPIIIRTANKLGIPLVFTLHNYRLLCPSSTLLNNGSLFTDSLNASFPWSAVEKKVYRDSYLQTFWLAFIVYFHKKIGTWEMVTKYITLNNFAKELFIHSSLKISAHQFITKPNFVAYPAIQSLVSENYFLFVGRLSEEKGIRILINAFQNSTYKLKIAGEGPLRNFIIQSCQSNKNIEYLGSLNKSEIQLVMQKCTALIFPSIWYEPFGLVIIEAFSFGVPVISSNIGAPIELIQDGINGLHFKVGSSLILFEKLNFWQNLSKIDKAKFRENATATYTKLYTPEINRAQLQNIYQNVI